MATSNGVPELPSALIKALPLFHRLNILTIFDIYKLQVGKLVFESLNNIGPSQSITEFTLASDIVITQDMQKIVTSMSKGQELQNLV